MGTKRVAAATVTCGLFATAGLIAVGGTQAQQPGPPTGTLQLVQPERDGRFRATVDAPPRRRGGRISNGDGFLLTGPVRDQAGRRVGRLQAVFVVTNARREETQASGTFFLADGRIVVEGADTRAPVDEFAITGGTGRYAGARGT